MLKTLRRVVAKQRIKFDSLVQVVQQTKIFKKNESSQDFLTLEIKITFWFYELVKNSFEPLS